MLPAVLPALLLPAALPGSFSAVMAAGSTRTLQPSQPGARLLHSPRAHSAQLTPDSDHQAHAKCLRKTTQVLARLQSARSSGCCAHCLPIVPSACQRQMADRVQRRSPSVPHRLQHAAGILPHGVVSC